MQVILRAVATMPSLVVSTDTLRFDRVQCGMCQVRTVQLSNPEPVPCQWSIAEEERPRVKVLHYPACTAPARTQKVPKRRGSCLRGVKCVCVCAHLCVCLCVYVCVSVCVYVCVQLGKHLPLHLRRKEKRPSAVVFEMLPSAGLLYPGDRVNVQVKFSPVEGVRTRLWSWGGSVSVEAG